MQNISNNSKKRSLLFDQAWFHVKPARLGLRKVGTREVKRTSRDECKPFINKLEYMGLKVTVYK